MANDVGKRIEEIAVVTGYKSEMLRHNYDLKIKIGQYSNDESLYGIRMVRKSYMYNKLYRHNLWIRNHW